MHVLHFCFYSCSMCPETFSEKIMIYKPYSVIEKNIDENDLRQLSIVYVSDLLDWFKSDPAIKACIGAWGLENLVVSSIYVHHDGYLLGLRSNKRLTDIFGDFETESLELAHFCIAGGASIHDETHYRFTIHPDEKIHEHTPHVHVSKAGNEVRYSLEDFQPMDPLVGPHKRDNKKIIIPFIVKNKERLLEMWKYYNRGYSIPEITENGQQFYPES